MPAYPDDPASSLTERLNVENDGYADHTLTTTMHVGTHIDAPEHMIAGGKMMHEYPAESFVGRGVVVDVRGKNEIRADCLPKDLAAQDIVLFYTGWSKYFGTPEYYEWYPEITIECAARLVRVGVSMVGLDSPGPDHAPFPVHKLLLGNDILIIENLRNLDAVVGASGMEIMAFPLRIMADASPARVIARAT